MKSSARNVKLASVDDLFTTEENRQEIQADAKREKVQMLPLAELHPFRNHPFKVKDDEAMANTVDSVRQYGVLVPAIARPLESGGYELVSGHRRHHASELAGLTEMPVIVRDLDDDAATIIMVDSNLQRETLLPSERAFAYKMKLEAMKRQAGRPSKENVSQVGTQKRSDQIMAEQVGESRNQIQRFIRLTALIPDLLNLVDEKKSGVQSCRGTVLPENRRAGSPAGRYGKRADHALSVPGSAAQKIQSGRETFGGCDARHYV